MTRLSDTSSAWCQYEYHGSTFVEQCRVDDSGRVQRRWLHFDTVEEALEFFSQVDGR